MVMDSIMAPVDSRDDDGNHFPLNPGERSGPTHQLNIQFVMLSHDSAVYSVNADDVVSIRNSIARRDLVFSLIWYERHRFTFFDQLDCRISAPRAASKTGS